MKTRILMLPEIGCGEPIVLWQGEMETLLRRGDILNLSGLKLNNGSADHLPTKVGVVGVTVYVADGSADILVS
jgi:hypothetical protein